MKLWAIITVVCTIVQVVFLFIARAQTRKTKRALDESTEKLIAAGKEMRAIINSTALLVEQAMDAHIRKRTGGNGYLSKGGSG